jgi:hypothetical protein
VQFLSKKINQKYLDSYPAIKEYQAANPDRFAENEYKIRGDLLHDYTCIQAVKFKDGVLSFTSKNTN